MKPFTKHEFIGVTIIILVVGLFFGQGILMSLLRARDSQRMGDLSTISDVLIAFHDEYGFFPISEDGKIRACKGDTYEAVSEALKKVPQFDRALFESGLRVCVWGEDELVHSSTTLPRDPKTDGGVMYMYLANGNRFQILAHLESKEDFYDPNVASRNISCGTSLCTVGKAYATTPLDRSIDEYEREIQKNSSGK